MSKPSELTPQQIKDAADRAEGKKPAKRAGGRPTVYKPTFPAQAKKLCELGATDAEMAEFFEVTVGTFYKWKHDFPELSQALKAGKEQADNRVEMSLYHRALGYKHDAVKIFMPSGATDPVYAPYVEQVPPDTTACIFWLKNRRPDLWRDVHKHEVGGVGAFDGKSDAELLEEFQREAGLLGLAGSETEH